MKITIKYYIRLGNELFYQMQITLKLTTDWL